MQTVIHPKPIRLTCAVCGAETVILPGCANVMWLCDSCGAAISHVDATAPRQKARPELIRKPPPAVGMDLETLASERERLEKDYGSILRLPGQKSVPKVIRWYGLLFIALGVLSVMKTIVAVSRGSTAVVLGEAIPGSLMSGLFWGFVTGVPLWTIGGGLLSGRTWSLWCGVVLSLCCAVAWGANSANSPLTGALVLAMFLPFWVWAYRYRATKKRSAELERDVAFRME